MQEQILKHIDGIDGVVFDYGGVVVRTPGDDWAIYPLFERHGLPRHAVGEGIRKYRGPADNGDITLPAMYRAILRDAGLDEPCPGFCDEAAALDAEAYSVFIPSTFALMVELKARGMRLGLLSNMSEYYYRGYYLKRAGRIREMFDAETVSWSLRLSKPGRPIYDIAAGAMGVPPARLLFLDDTPANVEAARAYGWQAEVFAPESRK